MHRPTNSLNKTMNETVKKGKHVQHCLRSYRPVELWLLHSLHCTHCPLCHLLLLFWTGRMWKVLALGTKAEKSPLVPLSLSHFRSQRKKIEINKIRNSLLTNQRLVSERQILPGHDVGCSLVVNRGRVHCPVVVRQLPQLHGVIAYRGQAVTARLPWQQHMAGLNVFLRNHGTAGGLGTNWNKQPYEGGKEELSRQTV